MWQPVQSFEAANYETKLHSADQTDVVLGLAVCHNTDLILFGLLFYFPPQKASLFIFIYVYFPQLQSASHLLQMETSLKL